MGFYVRGQSRPLTTGTMSATVGVTTPYLFNAGSGVQVPVVQDTAGDTLGILSGVQTWSSKIFPQPVITTGGFTSPAISGGNFSGVNLQFSGQITSGTFTQPVITTASVTSPAITGGNWLSAALTLPTITTGTFTTPAIAQGTASFLTVQSGTVQTSTFVSPGISMGGDGAGVGGGVFSGGKISDSVVLNLWCINQLVYPLGFAIIFSSNVAFIYMTAGQTVTAIADLPVYKPTGVLCYCICHQPLSTAYSVQWPASYLIAGTKTWTLATAAVDAWVFMNDGSNILCVDKQLNIGT